MHGCFIRDCWFYRLSAFAILTNSIIGSGILGLPYAFAHTGVVLGTILLLASAVITVFNLHILAKCASRTKEQPSSFYIVTAACLPNYGFIVDLTVFLQCMLSGMGYLIIIGGLMPDAMEQIGASGIWIHRQTWVLIGFIVVGPLACAKNLDSLRFTTYFAILCIFFLACVSISYSFPSSGLNPCLDFQSNNNYKSAECVGEKHNVILSYGTMKVFAIFTNGYTCQQVTTLIHRYSVILCLFFVLIYLNALRIFSLL